MAAGTYILTPPYSHTSAIDHWHKLPFYESLKLSLIEKLIFLFAYIENALAVLIF